MNATNRRRNLSRRKRIVFVVASLLLCGLLLAVAGEVVLRVYVWSRGWTTNCYAASLTLFEPQETRGYDLAGGFRLRSGTFDMSVNRQGFRGPEVTTEKPDGVVRIAVLGGSSVFGYLVNDGQEATRILESELRQQGREVQVINGGVPGYNLFQTISRYEQRIAPLQPDLVMIYLGFNDLAYICSSDPTALVHRFRRLAPWYERMLGHSPLYGFVSFRIFRRTFQWDPMVGPKAEITTAGAQQFHQNLQQLAEIVERSGARLVVCSQALAMQADADASLQAGTSDPQRFQQLVELGLWLRDNLKQFAEQNNVPFIDVYDRLPPQAENFGDYVHLTVRGERLLAEIWQQELEPLLSPTR